MRKLLVAFLLLAPLSARASTFDIYGFGSRALSMGGAATADSADFTGVFYNPSQLVLRSKINLGLGLFYEKPNMEVTPDNPSQDFTNACVNCQPPDSTAYTLGFVFPFAGKLRDRVALGVGLSLPTRNLIRVQAVDPNEPNWYLYQSSPDRINVFAGLGIRPVDWLSLGIGIQALSDFTGDIEFNVDLFNKQFKRRDIVNQLITKQAPVAGITIQPIKELSFGFSWRAAMALDFELPANIALGDLGNLLLDVKGTTFYTPHEFTFGVSGKPIEGLTINGDLEYARWSAAPNPALHVKIGFTGDLAKGLGLDKALSLDSQDAPIGFEDILIPRLGVEYHIVDRLAVRGGYFYRPTMVPKQNGLSNLLDGGTHAISGGIGFWFDSPLEMLSDPIEIAAVFQHGFVETRRAEKAESNPLTSYSYGGSTSVFSIDVRYNFDIASRPRPESDEHASTREEKPAEEAAPEEKPAPSPKPKQKPARKVAPATESNE